MDTETIGLTSAAIVAVSALPYGIRAWQRKITPNIVTWSLFTVVGFLLLLTYEGSGADDNLWPAVFGFINPLGITLIVIKKKNEWGKLDKKQYVCLTAGLISLGMWFFMRESENLVQYALYMAIIADVFAIAPTLVDVIKTPQIDRPFAWGLYGVGYGLAIFAITNHTFANYILPLWMFFAAWAVALPLIIYRTKKRVPLKEWI